MSSDTPSFAPFVLEDNEPAAQQLASAPADPHVVADEWIGIIEAMRQEIRELQPTAIQPVTSIDDVILRDRLRPSIERYGRALADEEEDRKTGNAANLASDFALSAQEMNRLSGLAAQARKALATAARVPLENNGPALDKAIRRGLAEQQRARHDDFHRILRRLRASTANTRAGA